jgi:hypothetical protein
MLLFSLLLLLLYSLLVEDHPFGRFFDDWIHPQVFFHRVKLHPVITSSLRPKSADPNLAYAIPAHAFEFGKFSSPFYSFLFSQTIDCIKVDNQEMEIPRERKAISTVVCPLPTNFYLNILMKTGTNNTRIHDGIHLGVFPFANLISIELLIRFLRQCKFYYPI